MSVDEALNPALTRVIEAITRPPPVVPRRPVGNVQCDGSRITARLMPQTVLRGRPRPTGSRAEERTHASS